MKSMWDGTSPRAIRERVGRLAADRRAAWGAMNAPQMVCHLAESLKMAMGELTCAPKRLPIRYPPLKQFIIYVAPFPKSVPTAPELLARAPQAWAADVADLQALVDRFTVEGQDPQRTWPDHPAFGRMSRRAWGVLVYRHMDHHLRQFGG